MRGAYHALLLLVGLGTLGRASVAAAQVPDTVRLTLGDAARIAAERSALVAEAYFSMQEARARREETRADLLPQVSGYLQEGERTINIETFGFPASLLPGVPQVIGPIKTIDLRGQLSQTLFDWSAIQRLRSAAATVQTSRVEEEVVRQEVGLTAATAYVEALQAEGELAGQLADTLFAAALVEIARAQLTAGVGVRLDLMRAEAQLARTRARLIMAETAVAQTRLTLLRAINLPLYTPIQLLDTFAGPTWVEREGLAPERAVPGRPLPGVPLPGVQLPAKPIPGRLAPEIGVPEGVTPEEIVAIETALEWRPDLRELAGQIRAAELQVSAIRAERLPSLYFQGDNGWIGTAWNDLPRTYTWNFIVSIPIFNGLRRQARVAEQRAAVKSLEVQWRDLYEQVVYEVRSALLQWGSAWAQVAASGAELRLAEAEVTEAEARFRAGVAGNADVVNAALRLSDSRTAYIDALAGYQAARVALAGAQGLALELP